MNRRGWIWLFCGCCVIAWAILRTRRAPDTGPPAQWVVRTYDVGDLLGPPDVAPPPRVTVVPPSALPMPPPLPSFGSGGRAATPPPPPTPVEELEAMIRRAIAPRTWQQGGHIVHFDRRLVVVQTRANHALVQGLLDDLRASFPHPLHIAVTWASLRDDQLAAITPLAESSPPSAARSIDPAALDRLPGEVVERAAGATHSGRWIELQSGRARTAVIGAETAFDQRSAAYAPQSKQLLDGASVRVRPTLLPDGRSVLLDVRAQRTRFGGAPDAPPIELPPALGSGSPTPLKLDRLDFAVGSISTAVRVPAGAAALIGAAPDGDPAARAQGRSLYLIIRVTPYPEPPRTPENP